MTLSIKIKVLCTYAKSIRDKFPKDPRPGALVSLMSTNNVNMKRMQMGIAATNIFVQNV